MKYLLFSCLLFSSTIVYAQKLNNNYSDSLLQFRQNYIDSHEVVKGKDKKYFHFYQPDSVYRIKCSFERIKDSSGLIMKTTGPMLQHYFKYGRLSFLIEDSLFHLFIYQSKDLMKTKEYGNYLFVPFTDLTNAVETYGGGRYIDLWTTDVRNNFLILDFNKAYNPYCAYAAGYQCPLPPRENNLVIEIKAGEKTYGKSGH